MGFPELTALAGLAVSAAGAGVGMSAAAQSRAASEASIRNALAATKAYQAQATPLALGNIANTGFTQSQKDIAAGKSQALQDYSNIANIPGERSPLPVDTNRLAATIAGQREAGATSQGYANMSLLNWLRNQYVNRNLGVIGNLASNVASSAGTMATLAGQRSAGLAGIGSLMSTAGNLAGIYGGLNMNRKLTAPPMTPLQQEMGPQ